MFAQYGFAGNTIVSFLGDHGESLVRESAGLPSTGLLATPLCPSWEITVRIYISQGEC